MLKAVIAAAGLSWPSDGQIDDKREVVVDSCLRIAHDVNGAQARPDELVVQHLRGVEHERVDTGEHAVAVENAVEMPGENQSRSLRHV